MPVKKIQCQRCKYRMNRRAKTVLARCSNCGGLIRLKKFPDRRFKKNRVENKSTDAGTSPTVKQLETSSTAIS